MHGKKAADESHPASAEGPAWRGAVATHGAHAVAHPHLQGISARSSLLELRRGVWVLPRQPGTLTVHLNALLVAASTCDPRSDRSVPHAFAGSGGRPGTGAGSGSIQSNLSSEAAYARKPDVPADRDADLTVTRTVVVVAIPDNVATRDFSPRFGLPGRSSAA